MPVYNLLGDIQVEYAVGAGKPLVALKSRSGISYRGIYTGEAVLSFRWVRQGKTQAWEFEPSIPQPKAILPDGKTDPEGNQVISITLEELRPTAGLLRNQWEGMFFATAIHIDVPIGRDIWVFLFRSPWFPLKLSLGKTNLSLVEGQSEVDASLRTDLAGGLSAKLSHPGPPFKKLSLVMNRKVGELVSEEVIAEVDSGVANVAWRPILRNFDLCLATFSSLTMGQLSEVAGGLGAKFSRGTFGPGSLQGEFLLCDGPLTEYSVVLRGDLGFFRHLEDSTNAILSW